MIESDAFLVARREGGKTTFLGGLREYLSDFSSSESVVHPIEGDEEYFYNEVAKRVEDGYYPRGTEEPYLVNCTIDSEILESTNGFGMMPFGSSEKREIVVCDLPGEHQAQLEEDLRNNIESMMGNKKRIIRIYEEEFASYFESDDPMDEAKQGKWEFSFKSHFLTSPRLIFLVNLSNFRGNRNLGNSPLIGPNIIKSDLVRNKERVAIVITACDLIDYVPCFEEDNSMLDGIVGDADVFQIWERPLYNKINNGEIDIDPRIEDALTIGQDMPNVDLFGVSVPEADTRHNGETKEPDVEVPDQDGGNLDDYEDGNGEDEMQIKMKDGDIVHHGFDTVVQWLHQT